MAWPRRPCYRNAMTVDAILFDLDGTLADTFRLIVSSWNAAISPVTGKTYSDQEVIGRFGIPDPAMLRREIPEHAWEIADETYHAHYAAEHGCVKAFEGIDDMLAELKRRRVPMGLCT